MDSAGGGTAGLEVRLLGGVDVIAGDRAVHLGGAKPRALFAMLAMEPDVVLSADRLVDGVWGEDAPPSVRSSVQVHISKLRRALATAGFDRVVDTRPGGYAFSADRSVVDVRRFWDRAAAAKQAFASGDLHRARDEVGAAMTLWRGAPLAGVADLPFATSRVASLEQLRLDLIDLAADVELALGRPGDVVVELERVVAEHPYREGSWARLSLGLYRTGRTADALDRLAALRRILVEDLGLEPSAEIVRLERAILEHDPELSGAAPVLAIAHALESRLPAGHPLIGRDAIVADIVSTLGGADRRLLTVVGPGGVGKTSVAVNAASKYAAAHAVVARFVDLGAVRTPDSMLPAVLAQMGVRTARSADVVSDLCAVVAAAPRCVIVLDNCEHLVEGVAVLAEALLDQCPALSILATSRQPIGVRGETLLECPRLNADDASELFVQVAQAADRNYTASGAELDAVRALTERLDGVPLAIELFATRVRSLGAIDMLARLDSTELLTASRRTDTPRHRSLGAGVAWSYALLDADEQRCLRRWSVLGGSADVQTMLAVAGIPGVRPLERLVDRSLVLAERTATGVRYRLLAAVQAFAAERLDEEGDGEEARRALLATTLDWAERLYRRLRDSDPTEVLADLGANIANVRIAHSIAAASGGPAAAQLLAAFGPQLLEYSGLLPELDSWVAAALSVDGLSAADRLVVLLVAIQAIRDDPGGVEARAIEAVELAASVADGDLRVLAECLLGEAQMMRPLDAVVHADRALAQVTSATDPLVVAAVLCLALTMLFRLRRSEEAQRLIRRHCDAGTRRFGLLEANVLFQVGRVVMHAGDLDQADEHFIAAGEAARRTLSAQGESYALFGRAEVALRRGDPATALALFRHSLALDLVVDRQEVDATRMAVARAACLAGELRVAEEQVDALRLADDHPTGRAAYHLAAGHLALARGRHVAAREHLVAAVEFWAEAQLWDVVVDLLDAIAATCDADDRARLAEAAESLRADTISLDEAVATVQRLH